MSALKFLRILARTWVPLVAVIALTLGGGAVYRMHGIFGYQESDMDARSSDVDKIVPFNPKRVLYEVFGPVGTVGSISYVDENAQPHRVDFATLPWSHMIATTSPSVFANLVAQGNSDTIGCRISVNGEVKDDQSSTAYHAQTFCLVKAA